MTKKKYVILIPDGFADEPLAQLDGRTPIEEARTPNMDRLSRFALLGRSHNVPQGFVPGSDVATLSLLGYDPSEVYTGRAPLEAAAQGIEMGADDWAFRCNLVTLEDGIMKSFTAGHISSEEATILLQLIQKQLSPQWNQLTDARSAQLKSADYHGSIEFYPGVSYRNLMIFRPTVQGGEPFNRETKTFPPHDYTDRPYDQALPQGTGAVLLRDLMAKIHDLFASAEVNRVRKQQGKPIASDAWLWGQGRRPNLLPFADRFHGIQGAMITAVDLLRGIAFGLGWKTLDVPNITGYVDTDFAAKGRYAAEALDQFDLVCIHVEATDEAGHEGSVEKKVRALEDIDEKLLPPLLERLERFPEWRLLISPDHPTPICLKTHSLGEVPWMLASSERRGHVDSGQPLSEANAHRSGLYFEKGWELMESFLFSPIEELEKKV